ncbi:hypothetical protein [Sunxiuqinia indica]|uniref:hypothetical protein n=1 Tax=Sunxiuqinia indica TaxID=2692584 RepID=UPI001356E296|nr:hypothetical protein [Sunxiuqinia indica]
MRTAYKIFACFFMLLTIAATYGVLTGAIHQLAITAMAGSLAVFFHVQSKRKTLD